MREEDLVDNCESAAFLTLSKTESTEIGKRIKSMAPSCFIYNVNFRTLVQEHKLDVEDDPGMKGDFLLADHLYNVQKDQNNDQTAYYVFSLIDMKNMVNDL